MTLRDMTETNRAAWNQVAPIHRAHNFARLAENFRQPGFSCLDAIETELLLRLGLAGSDVVQLGCNNGRELLSMRNLGARRCVGFDIADAFVAEARELAAIAGQDVAFEQSSIFEIPADHDARFDLAVITIGVLNWLPDLAGFYRVVARLLRPGGTFFAYECHPVMWVFDPAPDGRSLAFTHPYFEGTPFIGNDSLDYYGNVQYEAKPRFEFQHTLGAILQGAIDAGLGIKHFREYPHDISSRFGNLPDQPFAPPLSYTLAAIREPG